MVCIIVIFFVSFIIYRKNNSFIKEDNVTLITISQEKEPYTIYVEDVETFLNKLNMSQWKRLYTYDLKFSPVCYLKLEPGENTIQILGIDSENAYVCVEGRYNSRYYCIPNDAYEYVISLINKETE